MKPEFKTFQLKIEDADTQKGIIRGFASTFGNIDLGDDVVDPGAFKKTLQESKGIIPILADHNPSKQIGWNVRAEENEKGLFVEGKLNMESEYAREKYGLIKQALELGANMGLSIGYSVIKAIPDKERPSIRRLKEIKLYEYSVVTFPMNTAAMVTMAKSFSQVNTQDDFVQTIIKESKERGLSTFALIEALQTFAAANSVKDEPTELGHSLDRLLNALNINNI